MFPLLQKILGLSHPTTKLAGSIDLDSVFHLVYKWRGLVIKLFKVQYSDLMEVCFNLVLFIDLTNNRLPVGNRLQLKLVFYSPDENRMSQYDVKVWMFLLFVVQILNNFTNWSLWLYRSLEYRVRESMSTLFRTKCHNSLIFWATESRFCMEVHMDIPNKLQK